MPAKSLFVAYGIVFAISCLLLFAPFARASITSATATLSKHTTTRDTRSQIVITVTNTDNNDIRYLKVTRPSSNLTITAANSSYSRLWDQERVEFIGISLPHGQSLDLTLNITSSSTDMASTPWGIIVSDSDSGSNPFTPSGDLSFSISGDAPDTISPIIANVSLATTITSFSVSWTTDEAANSVVNFGVTSSYGSTQTSDTYEKNHTITVSGLTRDTNYYFLIDSADPSGNNADPYESFIVTSNVQPTPTPTPVSLPTSSSALPTSPIPDTTEPLLIISDVAPIAYKQPPPIHVKVSDESGVETVWYSVNNGGFVRISGTGSSSSKPIDFSFTPKHQAISGVFSIIVKAADRAGNVAISTPVKYTLDAEGPRILLASAFTSIMNVTPRLIGMVTDQSGVESIEYSVNEGVSWRTLPSIITDRGVEFNAEIPDGDREGTYSLIVRATDGVGNISKVGPVRYAIDRIAPRVGLVTIKTGSIVLTPDTTKRYYAVSQRSYTIYIPTAGGVVNGMLTLEAAGQNAERIPLIRSFRADVWEAVFTPTSSGEYAVSVELDDGVRPKVIIPLFTVIVGNPSCVVDMATHVSVPASVMVYVYDELQHEFFPWVAEAFDEKNPVVGPCYSWVLPKGTYRLQVKAQGYYSVDTSTFTVTQSAFISEPISMRKAGCLALYWFLLCAPGRDQRDIHPNMVQPNDGQEEKILVQIPQTIPSLQGIISDKDIDVVVMNSWLPNSVTVVKELEKQSVLTNRPLVFLMPYESDAFLESWKQAIHSNVPFIADRNGDFVETLDRHVGPLVVHVSRDGFIQSMHVLIMEEEVQKSVQ